MAIVVNDLGYLVPMVDTSSSPVTTATGLPNATGTAGDSPAYYIMTGSGGAGVNGGDSGAISCLSGSGGVGSTLGGNSGACIVGTNDGGATNGSAGLVRITAGAANGTGYDGLIIKRLFKTLPVVIAGASVAITVKLLTQKCQFLSEAGAISVTFPTGAAIKTALPDLVVGDSFEFMLAAPATASVTFATVAGLTIYGAPASGLQGAIMLRFVYTAANTFVASVIGGSQEKIHLPLNHTVAANAVALAADLAARFITIGGGGGADYTFTFPTSANILAAFPNIAAGDYVDVITSNAVAWKTTFTASDGTQTLIGPVQTAGVIKEMTTLRIICTSPTFGASTWTVLIMA
jgi:hypothetical protein